MKKNRVNMRGGLWSLWLIAREFVTRLGGEKDKEEEKGNKERSTLNMRGRWDGSREGRKRLAPEEI